MWLRLVQIKKNLSPTWRKEEKESNPEWRKKEIDKIQSGDKGKW